MKDMFYFMADSFKSTMLNEYLFFTFNFRKGHFTNILG